MERKKREKRPKANICFVTNKIVSELNNVRNVEAKNHDVYIVEHFSIIEMDAGLKFTPSVSIKSGLIKQEEKYQQSTFGFKIVWGKYLFCKPSNLFASIINID